MRAMRLESIPGDLVERDVERPRPEGRSVLVQVAACGVCRTDLHLLNGELAKVHLPVTPGHQIVGLVEEIGNQVGSIAVGMRVGIPWLGWTCGQCAFCRSEQENLCDRARFTGCHIDGGFAEYALADERYCFSIPETFTAVEAAPLLCAGMIGYRAYGMTGGGHRLGLYGFGSAAHILLQIARADGRETLAFTRPGDQASQRFARQLGAVWAGGSDEIPDPPLDAAIIFAPVGALLPAALAGVRKGGTVVCAGIHMTDIPSFPYRLLWGERTVRSVANLTRRDGQNLFEALRRTSISVETQVYPLSDAGKAIAALREGTIQGSAVLKP